MTIQDIKTNTNGYRFIKGLNLLGIERKNDNRNEMFIIYKTLKGLAVAVIPCTDGDTQPCYFGGLEYFATVMGCDAAGIKARYNNEGLIVWPVWYSSPEQWNVFINKYNAIINKYTKK